jgi:hypothetical protein
MNTEKKSFLSASPADVIVELGKRFASGNAVLVERATLTRAEWIIVECEVERLRTANERMRAQHAHFERLLGITEQTPDKTISGEIKRLKAFKETAITEAHAANVEIERLRREAAHLRKTCADFGVHPSRVGYDANGSPVVDEPAPCLCRNMKINQPLGMACPDCGRPQ